MNWSDLRAFLAVAKHGNLRQAADALGVTEPTISRRIGILEADLGVLLFDRARDGHRLTTAGAELLPDVRVVETAAMRVQQKSLGFINQLNETVSVAAGEWGAAVVARGLGKLTDGPRVELLVISGLSQEINRSPEIILSHGMPQKGQGITRRVGSISCAIYGDKKFAQTRSLPLADDDLFALPWLGFVKEQEHYQTMCWLREQMRGRMPVARLMNTDLMVLAAKSGAGVAVLPCFIGDSAQGLMRLSAPVDALRADYWTITQPNLSQNPAVRKISDWISECFRDLEIK